MMLQKKNSACIVMNDQGKLLLLRRSKDEDAMPDAWELPSGGIDAGESPIMACSREVQEEAGIALSLTADDLVDTEEYTFTKTNGDRKHVVEYTYLKRLGTTPRVSLSKEHYQYAWVRPADSNAFYDDKEDRILKRIERVFSKERL